MLTNKELAINGGTPVRTKPWLDNFTLGEAEIDAAVETIQSGYLSLFEGSHTPNPPFSFYGGAKVQELEAAWCKYYDAEFAVSMNSATSGLYAAVGALGLGFGDEIIVSPYTMSASATCALVYGAIPIFADVSLDTGCLDPQSIEDHITERTKAIIVVHQFGIPAEMDAIMDLANKYSLTVIEDCAQSHGAKYKDRYIGTIGDIGVFSLNVNKTIQVGEGAVCLTNDEELRYRLALIRNHGEAVVGPAGYENITNMVGFNYRLTEIGAALAIEQLKRLDDLNQIRIDLIDILNQGFRKRAGLVAAPRCSHGYEEDGCHSTFYIYPLRFLPEEFGITRDQFVQAVNAEGIKFFQGYVQPLYLQPIYQQKLAFKHGYPFSAPENRNIETNYHRGACPNAEKLHYEQMITNNHIRPPHTANDMHDIVDAVDKVRKCI
jgi:perosamine synthetase